MSSILNKSRLDKPQFSREHRLGLVVYGGVALAIYMNGICQEFYNAVRGRGIYKLIKALTDADIVVDIISGTSAGGINGVLLSYALANSQEKKQIKFEEFAEVWKDSGDINKLLFSKKYYGVEKSSFFNGVGYYKSELRKALVARKKDLQENAPEDDWFSEFGELDLFITGTDVLGKVYQIFDNTNCLIDIKDHHAIFHLKYRDYGENPFNPDDITCEALAKLCQITSCFPVAFPPVTVKLEPGNDDPDKKLVEWGSLNNRIVSKKKPKRDESRSSDRQNNKKGKLGKIDDDPGTGYRLHFVDGGVLDNRPFSYTIKEIYHRTAERRVFRKLFYVDPSPDRFKGNPKYKNMLKPNIVQVVRDSLIAMPRYESINNDLELINEHNEKVRRYRFLLADLETLLDLDEQDRENNDFYDQQRNVYLRTRLISLEDKILPLIFLKSEGLVKTSDREENKPNKKESRTKKLEKAARLLAEPFTDPEGSSERLELLGRLEKEICDLDVDYALRRYFFMTEYVYRLLDEEELCKWLKNKRKQEIGKTLKIDDDSAKSKKEEINSLSIDKNLLRKVEALVKELNERRKLVERIKDKLDKLFIYEGIENYFLGLLDKVPNKITEKEFIEKFYRAMLWLHGQFLKVELKIDEIQELSIQELARKLTNILNQNFQEVKHPQVQLNDFFENHNDREQLEKLKELSNQSIIKKLVIATETKIRSSSNISNHTEEIEHYDYIQKKLLNYFKEFEKLDTVLYPLDYLASTPEKQIIETFRISPEDAKLGLSSRFEDGERLDKKLAGDTLNAFGGFLKKSWRANDILWGRLDGLNRIVDALVTDEKIKNFPKFLEREAEKESRKQNKSINQSDYLDYLLEEALFSDFDRKYKFSSEADRQYLREKKEELKEKLKKIFPSLNGNGKNEEPLKKEDVQDFVNSLVSTGHLVILDRELNKTMEISIEEQLNWKQQKQRISIPLWQIYFFKWCVEEDAYSLMRYSLSRMVRVKLPKFNLIDCSFDSAVTALVVKKIAEESLTSISLKEKEEFFNKTYNIGLETLDDIPKSKLEELILKCIILFQDIFQTWQRQTQARLNRSKSSRLDFWIRLAFQLAVYGINFAIWIIRNFLVRRL